MPVPMEWGRQYRPKSAAWWQGSGEEMSPTLLHHLQGGSAAHPGPLHGIMALTGDEGTQLTPHLLAQ